MNEDRIAKLDNEIENLEKQIRAWEFAGEDDFDHDHIRLAELISERDKLIRGTNGSV
jgi:hypothetical protein